MRVSGSRPKHVDPDPLPVFKQDLKPRKQTKIKKTIAKPARVQPRTRQPSLDFFYKRSLFRSMAIFFKQEFKPYFKAFQEQTARPLQAYLIQFTETTMPNLLDSMSKVEAQEYLRIFEQVVFCHRYNRQDPYMFPPLLSYDVIRDPMYKYSKQAQDTFLQIPVLAFLIAWFCKSQK